MTYYGDAWKDEPEERGWVPPVIVSLKGMTPEKEYVEQLAQMQLDGKGDYPRKLIEDYMKMQGNPDKERSFLHLMLEMDDKGLLFPEGNDEEESKSSPPPLTDEERAERYTWPNRAIEEICG
jgi:hypothetical protein